ncbi:unnamed protein product [Tilletia controversa]|uniref:Zn(2)-C6 fungal-type domain-containing protein n=3 Tax=Tilletia TaxID=13289 RepID=A0A8X7MQ83_9BASI|nr:hypothetical protein CF336_g5412 [Tilletia laevis]KAE8192667.1 hypothetical protein CF328_g5289 [Tilletia controversa]KAE8256743.1 hypothetical protein A4X03_0g5098 [Tilletia caries]KAE8195868.1 hypothetical protein CF335_g4993 [Tilletia laevis]KAE8243746.1 hypothetical protein A4X06_0g6125 [Tilletia controversa]
MSGLSKRRNIRASQHRSEEADHQLNEHGKRPYPAAKTSRSSNTSSTSVQESCVPDIFKGANVAFAKLPHVKTELVETMWSTSSELPNSDSAASSSTVPHSAPSGPHRKGKHPRRPPEAQMHHFPRQSCNECHDHKVKCIKIPGGSCERCSLLGSDCKFSLPKKYGRPSKSASSTHQTSSLRSLPPRRQVKQEADDTQGHSTTTATFFPVTSMDHSIWRDSPWPLASSQPGSLVALPSSVSDVSGPNPLHFCAPASTTELSKLSQSEVPSRPTSEYASIESAASAVDQRQLSTGVSSSGEDLFGAPSPPIIGQQSFRNLRERAASIGSDSHGWSGSSSSGFSHGHSRAGSLDSYQTTQAGMSRIPTSSSPFNNTYVALMGDVGSQDSSDSPPGSLFTSLLWQQSALGDSAWDGGNIRSNMPMESTFNMTGPSDNGSVDFEGLMNTFDAGLFTSPLNQPLAISEVVGTPELGLGLALELASSSPTSMPSLLRSDLETTTGDDTEVQQQQQRSFSGIDQQRYSPKTPAASGSHLSNVPIAQAPLTACNWSYDAPLQLVSSPFALSDANSSPQLSQSALSSDGGNSYVASQDSLRSYATAMQQRSLAALLAPYAQQSNSVAPDSFGLQQGAGLPSGLGLVAADSRPLGIGSASIPAQPSVPTQQSHTMWSQEDAVRQAQGWTVPQQQPLPQLHAALFARSLSHPIVGGASSTFSVIDQHPQQQQQQQQYPPGLVSSLSVPTMALQAQRERELCQGWPQLMSTVAVGR